MKTHLPYFLMLSIVLPSIEAISENVTLYHINPLSFPVDPTNMNLGNLEGAIFYDFFELFQTFTCSDNSHKPLPPGIICNNKEYVGKNIGITELILEVNAPLLRSSRKIRSIDEDSSSSLYGPYATCNICTNGKSPIRPTHTCVNGTYVCDCKESNGFPPKPIDECTNPMVGRESTEMQFGPNGIGKYCTYGRSKETCATSNAAQRLKKGYWYSTLDIGKDKTWHTVRVIKRITKECHENSFFSAVEEYDESAKECFRSCNTISKRKERLKLMNHHRNISSICWVQCFSDTTLGKNATDPKGYSNDEGMTSNELIDAWAQPFRSNDPKKGGCQDIFHIPSIEREQPLSMPQISRERKR